MSRLTGNDAYSLMEAYSAVYQPSTELTEEQVWEEVENWVNSLLEEGYDFSEYTWEDMYEAYLDEMGQVKTTGQSTAVAFKPTPGAGSAGGSGSDGRRSSGRDRNAYQTSSSPGALRVKPANVPYKSRFAGARDAAFKKAQAIKGSPVVGPGPAAKPAPTAAAKPAAAKPAPTAAAKPAAAKPAPTAAAKPYSGPGYKKDTSVTDMIGRSQIRQGAPINTGNKSSDIRSMALRGSDVGGSGSSSSTKPTPTAPKRPMGSVKPGSLVSSFDMFDVVLGHLLDEGYADTEDAALAIMASMSEEWRDSIVGEMLDEANKAERMLGLTSRERARARNLNQYTDKPIFYKSTKRNRGDNSDPLLNKAHKEMTAKRQASHKAGRHLRGDTGESGNAVRSRYQANKDHKDGYPSIRRVDT